MARSLPTPPSPEARRALDERDEHGRSSRRSKDGAALPHRVVLFDGVCNFCHHTVNFIIDRDPAGYFHFASLQSEAGKQLLAEHGLADLPLSTLILLEDGQAWARSDAVLRIARKLNGAWPLLGSLLAVPKSFRDLCYRTFAARRYRWFGQTDQCRVPTPELRERFLDAQS